MANPASNLHVDNYLSNMLVAYTNPDVSYGHLKVPSVTSEHESGLYPVYSKNSWMSDDAKPRARSTESEGGGWSISQGSFKCIPYSFKHDIDVDDANNADPPIDLETDAAILCANKLLIRNERAFATDVFAASKFTGYTDQAGVSSNPSTNQFLQWNDYSSNPGADIEALKSLIQSTTGFTPNALFVGGNVNAKLRHNAAVMDRIKYTTKALSPEITDELMAQYFGVKLYVPCGAAYSSSLEGATTVMAYAVGGKTFLLAYLDLGPGLGLANMNIRPTAFAAIRYNLPESVKGKRVQKYWIPEKKSTRVENDESFVYKVVATDLAIYASAVVA